MKSHSSKALPEPLTAFTLLSNSNINANQRISILSSATSHNAESARTLKNEELMDSVTYDPIASILHRCDSHKSDSTDTLRANSTSFSKPRCNRNQLTAQQIAELKEKSRCKTSGLWANWLSDRAADGTLKPSVKASKTPFQVSRESKNISFKPHPYKKTISFNMVKLNDQGSFSLAISLPLS